MRLSNRRQRGHHASCLPLTRAAHGSARVHRPRAHEHEQRPSGLQPLWHHTSYQPDGSARVPRTRAREHKMRPPGRRQRRHQASCLPCARAPPDGMRAHRVRIAFELVSTSLGLPAVGSAGTSPAACRACALVDGCERVHHTRARTHGTEAVRSTGITPAACRARSPPVGSARVLRARAHEHKPQPPAAGSARIPPAACAHARQAAQKHVSRLSGRRQRWQYVSRLCRACALPDGCARAPRTRAHEH